MPIGDEEVPLDLGAALGASDAPSTQCVRIYVPNKDRNGVELGNQRQWVLEALNLLSEINGGATAMPAVEGVWLNDEKQLIAEHPVIVYSFIKDEPFAASIPRIREFLHRMGRETNQGEIGFEFDNWFFRIRSFDVN